MGKESAPSARTVSPEETAAVAAQTESLKALTDIAKEQYNLSDEQMARYTAAFQDPNNLANDDLAEFQSLISGNKVTAGDLAGKSLEDIIRESMLKAPASFQRQTEDYIAKTDTLAKKFQTETAFNTDNLVKSLEGAGYKYQTDLAKAKESLGTIDKNILADETGAATAGISSAFAEGSKQLDADLARRGLSGGGLDTQAQISINQQESLAKYNALSKARSDAKTLSDQLTMQKLGLSGEQYNLSSQQAQGIYGASQQGAGTIYQTGVNQQGKSLQAGGQGLSSGLNVLGQVSNIGQQSYGQAASLLGAAGSTYSQSSSGYGGIASNQQAMSQQNFQAAQQAAASNNAGIGQLVGTIGGAAAGYYLGGAGGIALGSQIGGQATGGTR